MFTPEELRSLLTDGRAEDAQYVLGPDSLPRDDVPHGTVTRRTMVAPLTFPGITRVVHVYVPAQYEARESPVNLIVFLDGSTHYLGPLTNAPTVLDNLIAQGEIPPTIAVFVDPDPQMRPFEFSSLGDLFARSLIDEMLPVLHEEFDITRDSAKRVICGISAGAFAAFTVAWERPESFGNVICHCGSFTDFGGADRYPSLIRRSSPRPIRVFLQGSVNDFQSLRGDWELASRMMASALKYRGYDHRLVIGEGGHNITHGGSIFPDTLRWIWPAS
jgi:enterochelin esterase family protein